ncbi:MAG: hypothetical protein GXO87_00070 [Chlorobi bacterium]|nr:hypothetical protein [Chlorobiota bacterium]
MKKKLLKTRIQLIIYFLSIIIITSYNNVLFLTAIIPLLIILANKDFFKILKKTIISIAFFNFIISLSYIIMSIINNREWSGYIILLNLRVFDAAFLTFLLTTKVNIFRAVSISKNLSFLLVLSYSQIIMYKRTYEDFRLSFRSRNLVSPNKKTLYNFIRSSFIFFFMKSMHNSEEISLAMKSRCFNND